MGSVRVGTVDLPARAGWDRYFGTLTYLELSGLFAAPVKTANVSASARRPCRRMSEKRVAPTSASENAAVPLTPAASETQITSSSAFVSTMVPIVN